MFSKAGADSDKSWQARADCWVATADSLHMKRDYDHLLRRQVFAACFCGERDQEESEGEGD
jgi:hypothetical protein